jgi:pyruvate/2-oxoglutarate/acetoin dehydrogenase E1 component
VPPVDGLTYHDARTRALRRELEANPDLLLLGGSLSLPFNPDDRIAADYPSHVLWPPISEFSTLGVAAGAAMDGIRTLVAVSTASFAFYGLPPLVLEAANVRYLSGGRTSAPLVVHTMAGSRRWGGAQHEHTVQAMLQNVPGLRVYSPGTPAEIDAVLHAALTGGDPCVIADHVLLAPATGPAPPPPGPVAIDRVRAGDDGLIVAHSLMVQRALAAAEALAGAGREVGVVSVPCLSPLDVATLREATAAAPAVLFLDESRAPGSPASHMLARVVQDGFSGRVALLCSGDAPAPYASHLLDEVVPTETRIMVAVQQLLGTPIRVGGGTRAVPSQTR